MDGLPLDTQDDPLVRRTPTGWLAVARADDPPRIGVVGSTEEEARARFAESRQAWRQLYRRAEAAPVEAVHADA